jgi:hypothetical protein
MITDWQGSPNVASLLSEDPRTGLKELKAAEVPLTKLRVAAALHTDGNTALFLQVWLRQRKA